MFAFLLGMAGLGVGIFKIWEYLVITYIIYIDIFIICLNMYLYISLSYLNRGQVPSNLIRGTASEWLKDVSGKKSIPHGLKGNQWAS